MAWTPILHQETRISLTPVSQSSILRINTNSHASTGTPTRKRQFEEAIGLDEEGYARKRLATEGSVFFRPLSKCPRTFLWRVLDDRKLLEVQCVDLVQAATGDHGGREGLLTFYITFSAEILTGGVQPADAEDKDALELFVLTAAKELHTVTLKRDLLLRDAIPPTFDPATCVKKFAPTSFSYRQPYRLIAHTSLELFVSLADGGLMRLERSPNETGSQWHETFFSEKGWSGTIKGWNPFGKSQTVSYGNIALDPSAIASIVKSPDGEHVWTVSLDYTLRAWDTKTGRVALQMNLLDDNSSRDDKKKTAVHVMSAEQTSLLQIVHVSARAKDGALEHFGGGGLCKYSLALHTPKDHRFRFYDVLKTFSSIEGIGSGIELRDVRPDAKLVPPVDEMLNTNIWYLEHFALSRGGWKRWQLWIRARSGAICKTFVLAFDWSGETESTDALEQSWRRGWTAVDDSSLSTQNLKHTPEFIGLDATDEPSSSTSDRWLEFLFYPGRFSIDSLESALHIYRQGRGLSKSSAPSASGLGKDVVPLKERLVAAISAKVLLRGPRDQPNLELYQVELQAQWGAFFALLGHLHNRRHDSIGFAFDLATGLPWTICADFVAPIRDSSEPEKIHLNSNLAGHSTNVDPAVTAQVFPNVEEDVLRCQLLVVAQRFRQYLSPTSQEKLYRRAVEDAIHSNDADHDPKAALLSLYHECEIANEISEDDFTALNDGADPFGGLGSLVDDHFLMILESLDESVDGAGTHVDLVDQCQVLDRYGGKLSISFAQETLQRNLSVLLDLLALVAFMHGDLEAEELDPQFRSHDIYESIILRLKRNELRSWLVGNIRQEPQKDNSPAGGSSEDTAAETVFESMFIGDWVSQSEKGLNSLSKLLTAWSYRWTFYLPLNEQWNDITCHVLANLLRGQNFDLATDFLKFVGEGPWQSYLKGRLFLATGDFEQASIAFKEHADDIAGFIPTPFIEANLLTLEERTKFGQGMSPYLEHVSLLFEAAKAYTYVADFATIALEETETHEDFTHTMALIDARKSRGMNPYSDFLKNSLEEMKVLRMIETRDRILRSLFDAFLQTGRFEQAFNVLTNIIKPTDQQQCLTALVKACLTPDNLPILLELPITGDLAQEADNVFVGLAKSSRQSGSTSATPPYHQILFAFRTRQGNFRGAASVLYEHLERLRHGSKFAMRDPEDDKLVQLYALLINTLACCGEEQAWLLADSIETPSGQQKKRKLVRIEDIRREYAAELDRRSDLLLGRFSIVDGNEMDVL